MRRARPPCSAWRRNIGGVRDNSAGGRRDCRGDAGREPRTEATRAVAGGSAEVTRAASGGRRRGYE